VCRGRGAFSGLPNTPFLPCPGAPPQGNFAKVMFRQFVFHSFNLEIELWKRPAEGLGAHWSRTLIVVIV